MADSAWDTDREDPVATAEEGDRLKLDSYVDEVEVTAAWSTLGGPVLFVRSTASNATKTYRLRAPDADEPAILEKQDGRNWKAHCRVEAEKIES